MIDTFVEKKLKEFDEFYFESDSLRGEVKEYLRTALLAAVEHEKANLKKHIEAIDWEYSDPAAIKKALLKSL